MQVLIARLSKNPILDCVAHEHACFEAVTVTTGACHVETALGNYDFSAGDIYLVPPGVMHRPYSEQPFTDACLHLGAADLPTGRITYARTEGAAFINLMTEIRALYLKRDHGYAASLSCLAEALMQLLFDTAGESRSLFNRHVPPFAAELRDYIHRHYADPSLTLSRLSAKFGYTPDYIRHVYRAAYGVTPSEYLSSVRLSQARTLIDEMPFYPLGEIARLCGFSDPLYFSRCFRRHYGVSPQGFRRRNF